MPTGDGRSPVASPYATGTMAAVTAVIGATRLITPLAIAR
jgi:hypothetical protein